MSSNGIFPTLSIKPGVEVLLGSAAVIEQRNYIQLQNFEWITSSFDMFAFH